MEIIRTAGLLELDVVAEPNIRVCELYRERCFVFVNCGRKQERPFAFDQKLQTGQISSVSEVQSFWRLSECTAITKLSKTAKASPCFRVREERPESDAVAWTSYLEPQVICCSDGPVYFSEATLAFKRRS